MKTYFDFEEKERAAMTEGEVSALLDAELMVNGVLKIERPAPHPIPDLPTLAQEQWFKVGGVYFRTAEQAQKFIELAPHDDGYESEVGYDVRFAKPYSGGWTLSGIPTIEPTQLYRREDVIANSKILKQAKAAKEANEKAEQEYAKAAKAMSAVTDHVWSDWLALGQKRDRFTFVFETFDSYVKMAGGDEVVAGRFLLKAFSKDEIDEAASWTGREIPSASETP